MKDYCARRKTDQGVVLGQSGEWRRAALRLVLSLFVGLMALTPASQALELGSGSNTVRLVFEAPAFGILIYDYHYEDGFGPIDSYDLLTAVDGLRSDLSLSFINFGDEEDPNYFLNAVTYNSVTLTNAPGPTFSPFWGQWASGGESGYPFASPIPFGSWTEGSGISAPYRLLESGASDGYVFGEYGVTPVTAPIPEPASGLLIGLGMGVLCLCRRRR